MCVELLERGSLYSYIKSDADIPYLLLVKCALNIAEAMAFLHQNKIIYRDVGCLGILFFIL